MYASDYLPVAYDEQEASNHRISRIEAGGSVVSEHAHEVFATRLRVSMERLPASIPATNRTVVKSLLNLDLGRWC